MSVEYNNIFNESFQIASADKILTGLRLKWITTRAWKRSTMTVYQFYKYYIEQKTILDWAYISFTEAFQLVKTRFPNILNDQTISDHFNSVFNDFNSTNNVLEYIPQGAFNNVSDFYINFYDTMQGYQAKVFTNIRTTTNQNYDSCINNFVVSLWNALDNVRIESYNCYAIWRDDMCKFRATIYSKAAEIQVLMASYGSIISVCYAQIGEPNAINCVKKAVST